MRDLLEIRLPHDDADQLFAVGNRDGTTDIARLDDASRTALRDRLYSAGELLRLGQLAPDTDAVPEPAQLRLFDSTTP